MSVFKLPYSVTACIRYIRYLTVILYSIFQVLFYVNVILLELDDHVLILLVLLFQMLNVAKEKFGRKLKAKCYWEIRKSFIDAQ